MTWKLKGSLLAAAVIAAGASSQAQAGFTYDLRIASGPGITDSHDATVPSAGGTYTLQLWGQISGDSNFTNDGWEDGFVSVVSSQQNGGAFTSGGMVTGGASVGTNVTNSAAGTNPGTGGTDINGDGIADWGTTSSGSTTGWTHWSGGQNPGFVDGSVSNNQSEQVNANTWEVLLATYTVTTGTLGSGAGTTTFTPFSVLNIHVPPVQSRAGLIYYQDDLVNATKTVAPTDIGVVFSDAGGGTTTPEPASLGLLALGGLALMNRRRKA